MHKNDNNKRKKYIEKILKGLLSHPEMSKDTSAKIDQWLIENETDDELSDMMRILFYRDTDDVPSKKCLEMLSKAKKRLNMTDTPIKQVPKIPLYRKTSLRVASAAAIVLVVMSVTFMLYNGDSPKTPGSTSTLAQVRQPITVESVEGVQKDVWLPDSTHIWVNSDSKIVYQRHQKGERHVDLAGEAYFVVEREEKSNPFIVHTPHLDVRVLGTEFDVKASPEADITEVTLFKGSVEVSADKKTQRLQPGHLLTYHHATGEMTVTRIKPETGAQQTTDWRNDIILADKKSVIEILRMVSNYYDMDLVFDTISLPNTRYSLGFSKHEPVDQVLKALTEVSGHGFGYQCEDNTITIYSKSKN